eukprot:5506976-Alexandrium_andersonii.AAC.1
MLSAVVGGLRVLPLSSMRADSAVANSSRCRAGTMTGHLQLRQAFSRRRGVARRHKLTSRPWA